MSAYTSTYTTFLPVETSYISLPGGSVTSTIPYDTVGSPVTTTIIEGVSSDNPTYTFTTFVYLPETTVLVPLPDGSISTSISYGKYAQLTTVTGETGVLGIPTSLSSSLPSASNIPLSSVTLPGRESITSTPTADGPSSTNNSATVTPVPFTRKSSKLATGAIVGTVIGVIVVLAFLALALFLIRRKRRRASAHNKEFPELGDTGILELDPESEKKKEYNGILELDPVGEKKRGELDGVETVKVQELEGRNAEKTVPARGHKIDKETGELEAAEIKRKPISRETNERKGGTEVAGWETYEAQNGPTQGEATTETGNAHSEMQHSTQIVAPVEQQALPPVTQGGGSGAVDEELLWLEQEEARMKESQARFQERKAQLLAQKRGGGGSKS